MKKLIGNKCHSCGVKFVDHLGIIGTCGKLQMAISALKIIYIWSRFDEGVEMNPERVRNLCKKVLDQILD